LGTPEVAEFTLHGPFGRQISEVARILGKEGANESADIHLIEVEVPVIGQRGLAEIDIDAPNQGIAGVSKFRNTQLPAIDKARETEGGDGNAPDIGLLQTAFHLALQMIDRSFQFRLQLNLAPELLLREETADVG